MDHHRHRPHGQVQGVGLFSQRNSIKRHSERKNRYRGTILELERVSFSIKINTKTVSAVRNVNVTFSEGTLYASSANPAPARPPALDHGGLALPTGAMSAIWERDGRSRLDKYRREMCGDLPILQSLSDDDLLENVCYPMELCGSSPKEAAAVAAEYIAKVSMRSRSTGGSQHDLGR